MDIIRTPGKFEGEPTYAPYYHEIMMEGGEDASTYDIDDRPMSGFLVTTEDVEEFPDLEGTFGVILWEDDNGFVHTAQVDRNEWTELFGE